MSNGSINISGSTVGVISAGNNANITIGTQQITALPNASEDTKSKLKQLIEQLAQELKKVPADKQELAKEIAGIVESLLTHANAKEPNKTLLKITADGLKEAVKALVSVIPAVLPLATEIAKIIANLG